MEQVLYGPLHVHTPPHMESVFMSYIPLMVPHTLYGIGFVWPHMYIWSPHMYDGMSMILMVLHTLYGIGI